MIGRRVLKILLAVIAVGGFLYLGQDYLGQLHRIRHAHWIGVCGIVLIHMLTVWVQALTLKWGLDSFDRPISEKESFVLFVVSSYANLLLPRSGVGTSALYLNRVRKCSMIDYSSVVLFNGALFVLACSGIGCLVFGIDWIVRQQMPAWWLVAGLPGLFFISLMAVAVRWTITERYRGPGHSMVARLNHATLRLTKSGNIWRMGLAHFVLVFLRALRLSIAFWAMGIEASFFAILLTSVLGDLAFVIAITPGALGFRETAIVIAAAQLGMSIPVVLSAAVLDRLIYSSAVVVVAQFMIAFVIKREVSDRSETRRTATSPEVLS